MSRTPPPRPPDSQRTTVSTHCLSHLIRHHATATVSISKHPAASSQRLPRLPFAPPELSYRKQGLDGSAVLETQRETSLGAGRQASGQKLSRRRARCPPRNGRFPHRPSSNHRIRGAKSGSDVSHHFGKRLRILSCHYAVFHLAQLQLYLTKLTTAKCHISCVIGQYYCPMTHYCRSNLLGRFAYLLCTLGDPSSPRRLQCGL